jgi:hypothetical protein
MVHAKKRVKVDRPALERLKKLDPNSPSALDDVESKTGE